MLSVQKFLYCIPATKAPFCTFPGFCSSAWFSHSWWFLGQSLSWCTATKGLMTCAAFPVSWRVMHASVPPKGKGRKRLRVLFPLSRVNRTLRGDLEPYSVAGCVECQEERVRQEKGLAVVSHLEGSGNGGGRGAGTGRQCTDTHPGYSRDLGFSIEGLGEGGRTGILFPV